MFLMVPCVLCWVLASFFVVCLLFRIQCPHELFLVESILLATVGRRVVAIVKLDYWITPQRSSINIYRWLTWHHSDELLDYIRALLVYRRVLWLTESETELVNCAQYITTANMTSLIVVPIWNFAGWQQYVVKFSGIDISSNWCFINSWIFFWRTVLLDLNN